MTLGLVLRALDTVEDDMALPQADSPSKANEAATGRAKRRARVTIRVLSMRIAFVRFR